MSYLRLTHLEKTFGQNRVVKDFTLSVDKGEFISLLGPSGCGKTTVLRMVAGFETPTSGEITIDGQNVTGLKANARNIGMMFQAYALFPNLTVAENVAFGLKVKGVARPEREARVAEMLTLIGLSELGGRYPFQLSGGQQQCAVIGAPDEERGQIVEAHVVLAAGQTGGDLLVRILQDHVKRAIAPYKYPRRVIFTDALPKTQTGKIQRFRLRS